MRIAITASTGLIGSALSQRLSADGVDVLRLVRRPRPARLRSGGTRPGPTAASTRTALDGVDAVVHLSGAPVASGRWTAARKQELRASRIGSTSALIHAMLAAPKPPPVLLAGSAIGWYGDTGSQACRRERAERQRLPRHAGPGLGRGVQPGSCGRHQGGQPAVRHRAIQSRGHAQAAADPVPPRRRRQDRDWHAVPELDHAGRPHPGDAIPARACGPQRARQPDCASARDQRGADEGPGCSAAPACGTPGAAGVLRLALGEVSSELLGSCRALPARLEAAGFTFEHGTIGPAVAAAIADKTAS